MLYIFLALRKQSEYKYMRVVLFLHPRFSINKDMDSERTREIMNRLQSLEDEHSRLRDGVKQIILQSDKEQQAFKYKNKKSQQQTENEAFHFKILQNMGSAVHIFTPSREIIFWNEAAESLYGWKACEVFRQNAVELLVDERNYDIANIIVDRICMGESWVGQFPLRKKTGEVIMVLMTETPMFENGEIARIISVSSDANTFGNLKNTKFSCDKHYSNGFFYLSKMVDGFYKPKVVSPQPLEVASTATRLATKLKSLLSGAENDVNIASEDNSVESCSAESSSFKLLSSMRLKENEKSHNQRISDAVDAAGKALSGSLASTSKIFSGIKKRGTDAFSTVFAETVKEIPLHTSYIRESVIQAISVGSNNQSRKLNEAECSDCSIMSRLPSMKNGGYSQKMKREITYESESSEKQSGACELHKGSILTSRGLKESMCAQNLHMPETSSLTNINSCNSSTEPSQASEGLEVDSVGDCEIHWKDLCLGEVIGQGSCAIVYRGLWHGSDIAAKLFTRDEYSNNILSSYKKEVNIMKKLRHPNVLLFMGAVYAPERLAIITEYLPRENLFKNLHSNRVAFDMRRRLLMALDVARGVNYLHHRNPPIIHGDLKSSNLLVDKNWTVKVGDFGLSQLKHATYLSANSGRGTPQWMAPEFLRNEASNEKSDVYSFGVVLWELITEQIPWENLNYLQVVSIVGFMDRRLEIPHGIDTNLVTLIEDCWHSDPMQRPSFKDILERMKRMTKVEQRSQN